MFESFSIYVYAAYFGPFIVLTGYNGSFSVHFFILNIFIRFLSKNCLVWNFPTDIGLANAPL